MENIRYKYTPSMKVYTTNVLPPFPITRFLRLASSAICDIWVVAFPRSKVSKYSLSYIASY